jgi:hypothetical protein
MMLIFAPTGQDRVHAASLDYSTASNVNVPVAECEALLDLYDSTNGPAWTNNTNWDADTDVTQEELRQILKNHITHICADTSILDAVQSEDRRTITR